MKPKRFTLLNTKNCVDMLTAGFCIASLFGFNLIFPKIPKKEFDFESGFVDFNGDEVELELDEIHTIVGFDVIDEDILKNNRIVQFVYSDKEQSDFNDFSLIKKVNGCISHHVFHFFSRNTSEALVPIPIRLVNYFYFSEGISDGTSYDTLSRKDTVFQSTLAQKCYAMIDYLTLLKSGKYDDILRLFNSRTDYLAKNNGSGIYNSLMLGSLYNKKHSVQAIFVPDSDYFKPVVFLTLIDSTQSNDVDYLLFVDIKTGEFLFITTKKDVESIESDAKTCLKGFDTLQSGERYMCGKFRKINVGKLFLK